MPDLYKLDCTYPVVRREEAESTPSSKGFHRTMNCSVVMKYSDGHHPESLQASLECPVSCQSQS